MRNVLERVINLLAFLLTADRPVTADEIRYTVAGYDAASDEAFRRTFERDKELLRRLGVPLQLKPTDEWAVESGYVVPADEYRLPDPDLTDEERTALWLAAQVVRIGGRPSGPEAVLKLGGARLTSGVEPLAVELGAEPGLLGDLFSAVTERRMLHFEYRDRMREVEPHGLGHRLGHWYLVGREREEIRIYRIDRMGSVEVDDRPASFERDPDLDIRKALFEQPWEAGEDEPISVTVRFDPEVSWWAVRRLGKDALAPSGEPLDIELEVRHVDAFIGWLLTFGDQAEVLGPEEIRTAVIERVSGVA